MSPRGKFQCKCAWFYNETNYTLFVVIHTSTIFTKLTLSTLMVTFVIKWYFILEQWTLYLFRTKKPRTRCDVIEASPSTIMTWHNTKKFLSIYLPLAWCRRHLQSAICGQCSSRSACAVWPESYTVRCWVNGTLIYRLADSVALRSDCADAQADLELHCPHMADDNGRLQQAKG